MGNLGLPGTSEVIEMREIGRAELQRLVASGAQLVEVLPAKEYEEDHLLGAINLPLRKLEADPARRIEEVMRPGPSTFRPHVAIAEMASFMVEHDLETSPITSSDGRLIGILVRDDAVAAHKEHEGLA